MADSREALTRDVQTRLSEILRLMEADEKVARPIKGSTITFSFAETDIAWYVAYKTAV